MAIREGRWDCQYCGTKGILGRHKACPVCATSRPQGTKFYLPDEAAEVTDVEQLGYARLGPDWICEYCGSSNAANHTTCQSCFSGRTATASTQKTITYQPSEAPRSGDMTFETAAVAEEGQPDAAASILDLSPGARPGARTRRPVLIIAGLVALLICGLLGVFIASQFGSQAVDVVVSGYEWRRSIEVEVFQTVTEEDWSLPPGGRLLDQQEEVHHYDQVLAGYETRSREIPEQVYAGERTYVCGSRDLGNGFFEDVMCSEPIYETRYRTETYQEPIYNQVPIYQTRYTYEIEKWVVDYRETADGRNRTPYWPRLDLDENEREGSQAEEYRVIFSDEEGRTYQLAFPEAEWNRFREGEPYTLTVDASGEAVKLEE